MKTQHFSQFPKVYQAYPMIFKHTLVGQWLKFKKQLLIKDQHLPAVSYEVNRFIVDTDDLNRYCKVCDFQQHDPIPATYFMVLAQRLQMQMMSQEAFPFDILGLVHIANKIKQYRPAELNEVYSLLCSFGETRPHDKGVQFDFIIEVRVGSETVIHAVMTYLSRQKIKQMTTISPPKEELTLNYQLQADWTLEENLGRRYAYVSGDFNFIHLHAVAAKMFGFQQAIAHGMWTNAKVLASIPLPRSYELDVQFKLPVFLPSTVEFLTAQYGQQQHLLVRQAHSHKPHLVATLR